MWLVRIGDWPTRDAGDESAEHRVDADRVGRQRHQPGYHQDRSNNRDITDKAVVRPADNPKYEAAPDRETQDEKDGGAEEALGEGREINATVERQPEDHRHYDPADRVVDDRGCDDHLADRAAKEADLAHHHGNDLYR